MQSFKEYFKEADYVIVGGLHGDEPASNLAAEHFEGHPGIKVYSHLNKSSNRRIDGKDPNRHFDKDDQGSLQDSLLKSIERIKPSLVICLHEDDEVEGVYCYCSKDIKEKVKACLTSCSIPLATSAHNDKTDGGVIVDGNQPYEGTLERALERRNIRYCTIETPSSDIDLKDRVVCLINICNHLLNK